MECVFSITSSFGVMLRHRILNETSKKIMFLKKSDKYAIRKLSVGVRTVAIGTFLGGAFIV